MAVFPKTTTEEFLEALRGQSGVFFYCTAVNILPGGASVVLPWTLTSEFVKGNRGDAKVDLLRLTAQQAAYDLKDLWMNGDVSSPNPLYRATDGAKKQGLKFKDSHLLLSNFTTTEYRRVNEKTNDLEYFLAHKMWVKVIPNEELECLSD